MKNKIKYGLVLLLVVGGLIAAGCVGPKQSTPVAPTAKETTTAPVSNENDRMIDQNAQKMMEQGRQTFRFDTFGDEAFLGRYAQDSPGDCRRS